VPLSRAAENRNRTEAGTEAGGKAEREGKEEEIRAGVFRRVSLSLFLSLSRSSRCRQTGPFDEWFDSGGPRR